MDNPGFIYVMDRGDARKIGWSGDPESRSRQVAAEIKAPVTLVKTIAVDHARGAEKAAHIRLAAKRLDGEWFDIDIESACAIIEWAAGNPEPIETSPVRVFRFNDEELALLEEAKKRHGTYKAAAMAGLRALDGDFSPTKADVIAWIERNA